MCSSDLRWSTPCGANDRVRLVGLRPVAGGRSYECWRNLHTGDPHEKRVLFVATVAAVALASFGFANRAPQPYRVVFDLTSRDSLDQKAVVRWIKEVSTSSPTADIEVVMYAKGFELVMPDKSNVLADVQTALKNPKVAFKVCAIALARRLRRVLMTSW